MMDLFRFLNRLEASDLRFSLSRTRRETILVEIAVPGERWEVEFFDNGEVEVEVFKSEGIVPGTESLKDLFRRYPPEPQPTQRLPRPGHDG